MTTLKYRKHIALEKFCDEIFNATGLLLVKHNENDIVDGHITTCGDYLEIVIYDNITPDDISIIDNIVENHYVGD